MLRLERDPLEVLRLGTHVGSCFGLGGDMAHSALAIMLDVNKVVVFARAGERVLGRQVLAISEAERLVPFEVYAQTCASPALLRLFKSYDEAFARQLGLPIERPGDESEVELVLAASWWDDGTWDLEIGGRRQTGAQSAASRPQRVSPERIPSLTTVTTRWASWLDGMKRVSRPAWRKTSGRVG